MTQDRYNYFEKWMNDNPTIQAPLQIMRFLFELMDHYENRTAVMGQPINLSSEELAARMERAR